MSDVFVSYSRRDRARIELLARKLESSGLSVWFDRAIPPGKNFDEVIEDALAAAGCVVVLWSESSVKSTWVKTEAAEAARRGVLIPILIDPVQPPLEFRRLQTADLSDWAGEAEHLELDKALTAIGELLGRSSRAAGPATEASSTSEVPELATEAERRSLLLKVRTDGGGWTGKQLAVGYLIGVVVLILGGQQFPLPQELDPLVALALFLAIPVYAMVRLRDAPFRAAGVFGLGVLIGTLVVKDKGADPAGFVLGAWLIYGVVASVLWALSRWRKAPAMRESPES